MSRRCVPCKTNRTKTKDTKTTAVCDLCLEPTCVKHYIRTCEKCYCAKFNDTVDILEESSDEDNVDIDVFPGPSTARQPSKKRIRLL